ncbi:MAG: hypothetical protein M1514_02345 [Patescibacteria group bacterium]|nr:hypothetical protein [Patescibacteria group bacterium]
MNNILIYSGDDLVSSRRAFMEQLEAWQKQGLEVIKLSGKEISEESLELLSGPTSLFGNQRAIAIESLLSGAKSKEKENSIKLLATRSLGEAVVIWENKEFSKADQLKYPKNFVFRNFKLPAVMFTFLEGLAPGKTKNNIGLLHQALTLVEPGYLFLMLVRQIRMLILAKDPKDVLKIAPWQKGKLLSQAKLFKIENLISLYQELSEIDYQEKTSGSPFPLGNLLELFVTKI